MKGQFSPSRPTLPVILLPAVSRLHNLGKAVDNMADSLEGLAQMASSVVQKLYYFGNLCVTLGVFLIVVAMFREQYQFVTFATPLIVGGFAVAFWSGATWKNGKRYWAIAFSAASLAPSHFYALAFAYLK